MTLQKVDQKREDVGVELYGYQQQLAKLQLGFEKAQDQCLVISKVRRTLEEQLDQLKKAATSELDFTQKERQKARWQAHLLTFPSMTPIQILFLLCKPTAMACVTEQRFVPVLWSSLHFGRRLPSADNEQWTRLQVEGFQSETDKLAASLKNIEKYNEEMKGEIAVTKR